MAVGMTNAPRRQRRSRIDYEGQEQAAYFWWLYLQFRDAWEHTFHPPNGGSRTKAEAGIFKTQGVKAGVPDIVMDLPRGAYHGLRIELKASPPNHAAVSPSQKEWNLRLCAAGYCAVICKGIDAAKQVTEAYLSLGAFDGKSRIPG
jgi:hypothetical protein